MRKLQFENDKYYHIYNRGVDKRDIFLDERDFGRFIVSMREFNVVEPIGSLYEKYLRESRGVNGGLASIMEAKPPQPSPLVEFVCYCLNKNHYHFILKQLVDNGIAKLMQRLSTGYTMYFNKKQNRSGSLFQGPFKAKYIDTAKYLAWCSAYVNSNVEIHKLAKAKNYPWSSYKDYLNLRNGTLCDKIAVTNEFNNNTKEYEEFVDAVIKDCQKRKDAVKEYLAELEL
ncbi:MAG: transposase [bacterium]